MLIKTWRLECKINIWLLSEMKQSVQLERKYSELEKKEDRLCQWEKAKNTNLPSPLVACDKVPPMEPDKL